MMALTMEIVARALFSRDVAGSVRELGAAIDRLIEGFGRPAVPDLLGLPEWLPRRRDPEARRALAYVDGVIYEIIRSRRAAPDAADDLLGMLLDARDEETGEGMTDRQLRDEVMTLFAAGHETTAVALTWCWSMLARHPDVEARLHAELETALAGRRPGFDDLERLPYARMVVEETMRLYPPAYSLNRVALADDAMGPHRVRKGALVTVSPWVTHRNPRLWPDPLRFDPERFSPEAVRQRHRYAYFPFGGGPRVCIGNAFALMEARLALAVLAQDWRLASPPGAPPPSPQARVTLRPREPLLMRPLARR
jgi:cytochrome P450